MDAKNLERAVEWFKGLSAADGLLLAPIMVPIVFVWAAVGACYHACAMVAYLGWLVIGTRAKQLFKIK